MDGEFESTQLPLHPGKIQESENESSFIKCSVLANHILENMKAADLKWSLFCAACNSYRFDSVLKPFPPMFAIDEDNKDIERLREVVESCPSLTILISKLQENKVSKDLLDLVYWVLIYLSNPTFKMIAKEQQQEILSQVMSVTPAVKPDFIFSVTYDTKHQQKFALTAANYTTKYVFHGSRLDNFYSIVKHGLQVSFNKVAAFGPGIYLSSEMSISLPYSPRGFTWRYSSLGSHISIVALCEVIDHPDVKSEFSRNNRTNFFDSCSNQPIPGKYLIVENSDLVRVRYLLVYNSDDYDGYGGYFGKQIFGVKNTKLLIGPPVNLLGVPNITLNQILSLSLMQSPTLLGWIKRHKMFTIMAAYIILLLAIGSSNSSLLYKYGRRLLRKFNITGR